MMSTYGDLVEGLIDDFQRPRVKLDPGNGEYHLRTLVKMAQWAADNQPVKVGDRVNIDPVKVASIQPDSGWHPWRDKILAGPHEVTAIDLNGVYEHWYFSALVDGRIFNFAMDWAA